MTTATAPALDVDAVRAWLSYLGQAPGLLSICSTGNWAGRAFEDVEPATEYVRHLDAQGAEGIYARVTTLRERPTRRGGAELSHAFFGLWADLDIAGPGHKATPAPLPPDEDEARHVLAAAGLPEPSRLIHSGGGLYPWWLLTAPHILGDDRAAVEALSARWQEAIARGAAALGYHYGTGVGDLARVLRIAGTVNRKEGLARPCRMLPHTGPSYSLAELQQAAPDRAPAEPVRSMHAFVQPGSVWSQPGMDSGSPFDALADTATWSDLLIPHGWTLVGTERDGAELWKRPGGTSEYSARCGHNGVPVMVVHSTDAGLPAGPGNHLTKGRVFAHLNHRGNESAAASDLRAAASGDPAAGPARALPGHVLAAIAQRCRLTPWTPPRAAAPAPGGDDEDEQAGPAKTAAARLVDLAEANYRVFLGQDGEPYAAELDGSSIVRPLRGRAGLRQQLSLDAFTQTGKPPSTSALSDALNVLEAKATVAPPEVVHLRVARAGNRLVIDMGTQDGRLIECGPDGWKITTSAPVLFRRTALTGAMPEPLPNGTLDAFRSGLNADEENFRLIVGWMLHTLIPDEPHPVLGLVGEQGTAKTTGAKHIVGIIDPSPAPTRSAPKDAEDWAVTASGSWVVPLDNISSIPPWFSDALCKAVTGDAMTRRALYTNSDLAVLAFLRPVLMTSIEAGALRGDLAERMLPIELQRINPAQRRPESDVRAAYEAALPGTLGALLNLLCNVLAALPDVQATNLPRMADFTRFLIALDKVTGWTTREDYEDTFTDLADNVIDGDPFATAIRDRVHKWGASDGTAKDLLAWAEKPLDVWQAVDTRAPKGWPRTPRGAAGALARVTPALIAAGITVDRYKTSDAKRERRISIRRAHMPPSSDGRTVTPDGSDGTDFQPSEPHPHSDQGKRATSDGSDGSDGSPPLLNSKRRGEQARGPGSKGVGTQPSEPSEPSAGLSDQREDPGRLPGRSRTVGRCTGCGEPMTLITPGQVCHPNADCESRAHGR
ncbi:hypothetical protein [Actinomadura violacea]|uniref:ATP-binding protein n=1 Tax=Actinomadura violacea TaxID=2819934 RepID=A0ABS3RII8_9ACTN|nr:hypothetical protein [Actinomadura violacea]MBO2456552.1 hypothetical protein [Actinomadura violacea]